MSNYRSARLLLIPAMLLMGLAPAAGAFAAAKTTPATAKNQTQNITSSITQSYNADTTLEQGIMVKVKDKDTGSVEPLKEASIQKMFGVVVAPGRSPVTLTPESSVKQQVFVATSGRYEVLVTNQNGVISPGDFITISAISGIGMRADENQTIVLGKAVSGFTGTKQVISSVKLKDQLGHDTTVAIGRVVVDLSIAHNPLQQKASDYLPAFLAKAAVTVASKPVSVARIYFGLAILVVSGFLTANVVYSGVRSGMIAIGRNPLSKKSIIKSLIQTVLAGLIIFIAGIFAVYLLLKL